MLVQCISEELQHYPSYTRMIKKIWVMKISIFSHHLKCFKKDLVPIQKLSHISCKLPIQKTQVLSETNCFGRQNNFTSPQVIIAYIRKWCKILQKIGVSIKSSITIRSQWFQKVLQVKTKFRQFTESCKINAKSTVWRIHAKWPEIHQF